jgi:hypothetical protein
MNPPSGRSFFGQGISIDTAASDAVALAKLKRKPVRFFYNGIEVIAEPAADPKIIAAGWRDVSLRQSFFALGVGTPPNR